MTMIEVPTWDGIDERLAAIQAELRYGTSRQQGERIVADLAELRGDLAALRVYERSQRGTPVVTRVLDEVEPQPMATTAPADELARRAEADRTSVPPETSGGAVGHVSHDDVRLSGYLTARETAIALGFTGNICDVCGGPNMLRDGTCERCQDCGSTTGCS